ncbi:MAG: hypothetical protein NVS2B8_07000 [Vulcanimicrobiaceae bacterium]
MTREVIVASVGGGIAASYAMDVVQMAWAAAFERDRATDVLDEETEAIASVVRAIARFAPALRSPRRAQFGAKSVHYALGVAFAAAYVAAIPRARMLASANGVAFGTGLFVLSDRILIPMLKLGRSWDRYSRSERLNALASHVAYGVVLESVRARVDARGIE